MALGWQKPQGHSWSDQPFSEEIPMSTAAISGSSIYQQVEQYFQTRQSDLQQLGQALDSNDLAGAQSAYNNIVQLGQSGPFASGEAFSRTQREQDFTALGQALQSGDLAGAQAAFSTLQSTFQRGAGTQAPVSTSPASSSVPEIILNLSNSSASPTSNSPASSSGPEIVLNLSNSGSGVSPEQITINLTPTSGGGEQVALSIGSPSSNEQQITFNLSPNSNEQIVLNLLSESSSTANGSSASTSSSSGSSSASGGFSVSA
jgi:hypothetical protein